MNSITIRVPGTSANVGPGFDSVGFAVSIYNTLSFSLTGDSLSITGCPKKYQNKNNLACVGFRRVAKIAGKELPAGISIDIKSEIPFSRGLGSSAAMITAGAFAANELLHCGFSRQRLVEICTGIEGHPDNIAPALLGGLTASYKYGNSVMTVKYNIHDSFHFSVLIPEFDLPTSKARKALPETIPFKDAVFNVSRAAVLYKAFEDGNTKCISSALQDRMHQNYRKHLIAEYDTVVSTAIDCGALGVCISGAGPTLMCITDKEISKSLESTLSANCNIKWQVLAVDIDNYGIKIL